MSVEAPVRTGTASVAPARPALRLGSFSPSPAPRAETGGSRRQISGERIGQLSPFIPVIHAPRAETNHEIKTRIIMPEKRTAPAITAPEKAPVITRRITQGPEKFQQGDKTRLFDAFPPPAERARVEQQTKSKGQSKETIPFTIIPQAAGEVPKPRLETKPVGTENNTQVLSEKRKPEVILPSQVGESIKTTMQPEGLPKAFVTPTTEQKLAAVRIELARMQAHTSPVMYETAIAGKPLRVPKAEVRYTEQISPSGETRPQITLEQIASQPHAEVLPRMTVEPTTNQKITAVRAELSAMIQHTERAKNAVSVKPESVSLNATALSPKTEAEPKAKEQLKQKAGKKQKMKEFMIAQAQKVKKRFFVRDEKADEARIATVVGTAEKILAQKEKADQAEVTGEVLAHALSPALQPKDLQSEIIQQSLLIQTLKGGGADGSLVEIAKRLKAEKPIRKISEAVAYITALVKDTPAVRVSEGTGERVNVSNVLTVLGFKPNLNQKG